MPRACPQCGGVRVVEEELYSQTQCVCEDCGFILSEGILTSTLSDEQNSTAVPYYISTRPNKRPCPNLVKGLGRVRALCRILRLPSDMESAAVSLYEQSYNHAHFLHVRLAKKEILGGCCVLCVCRQRDWPVAIGTISMLLEADSSFIGGVYQDLIKALNIPKISSSITDMLESHCHGFNLSPGAVPDVCVESVERLVQRSAALLELAADVWLVTGRHPLPILTACVYLAWQSLKPTDRMRFSLNKFCAVAKLPKQSSLKRNTEGRRAQELREGLCKLGRELPWLGGAAVEPGSVVTLVDDILQHRRALMLRAVRSHEAQLEHDADGDEEQGSGERQPFIPPSARNPKRRRRRGSDAAESQTQTRPESGPGGTGDQEISDTEIESYIRSPEEMEFYQRVHQGR